MSPDSIALVDICPFKVRWCARDIQALIGFLIALALALGGAELCDYDLAHFSNWPMEYSGVVRGFISST